MDLFKDFCNTYTDKPSLKVAGINPHAGEEGVLGHEEKDWLNDALITWNSQNRGIKLSGPLSPDSCWNSSIKAWNDKNAEKHDGILAMYHDQGLIPMKVIAFITQSIPQSVYLLLEHLQIMEQDLILLAKGLLNLRA